MSNLEPTEINTNSIYDCVIVPLKKIHNRAGNLTVVEGTKNLPFEVRSTLCQKNEVFYCQRTHSNCGDDATKWYESVFFREGISPNGSFTNSTPLDKKLVTDHITITTSLKPGKVYQYQIESTDSFENTTFSKTHTVLTPQPKQNVVDVIINNFEESFGFLKRLRF